MKPRVLAQTIRRAIKTFPAVVVTGPRQSGKTTLLKTLFATTHEFVTLEDPDVRIRAKEDPKGFLEDHPPPVILDEIQYVPQLLSYIKTKIDQNRKPGQWLFTGSQNFVLMQSITQSLAGRVAVLSLLPFSLSERMGNAAAVLTPSRWVKDLPQRASIRKPADLSEILLRGHYPEIASRPAVDRSLWCSSYISTFLERDVRNIAAIGDLSQFERFLKLCATRTGQLLNLSEMAKDIGVSVPTAKRWLSILEAGYQVYLLYPYYKNIGKRLVKSPKLYFSDTGLATYLLGLQDRSTLMNSPSFGPIFETFIVVDMLKRFLHSGEMPSLYYLRSRDGLEVDMILEIAQKLYPFEIKGGATITPRHAASLVKLSRDLSPSPPYSAIISRSAENFKVRGRVINLGWQSALTT